MLAKKSKKWRRFPANRARFFHPPRRIFSGAKNWRSPILFAHTPRVARPVPRQPKREQLRAIFALFSRTTGTAKRSLFVDKTAWPTCGHVTAIHPGTLLSRDLSAVFADAPRLVESGPRVPSTPDAIPRPSDPLPSPTAGHPPPAPLRQPPRAADRLRVRREPREVDRLREARPRVDARDVRGRAGKPRPRAARSPDANDPGIGIGIPLARRARAPGAPGVPARRRPAARSRPSARSRRAPRRRRARRNNNASSRLGRLVETFGFSPLDAIFTRVARRSPAAFSSSFSSRTHPEPARDRERVAPEGGGIALGVDARARTPRTPKRRRSRRRPARRVTRRRRARNTNRDADRREKLLANEPRRLVPIVDPIHRGAVARARGSRSRSGSGSRSGRAPPSGGVDLDLEPGGGDAR